MVFCDLKLIEKYLFDRQTFENYLKFTKKLNFKIFHQVGKIFLNFRILQAALKLYDFTNIFITRFFKESLH